MPKGGPERVRLVNVMIQPAVVVDDGRTLTELSVDPIKVSAVDWPNVVSLLEAAIEKLEEQVNAAAPEA